MWLWTGARPAVDDDGVFGPVGLLPNDVDKLQDAFNGVDRGDAVIWPRSVVEVEHVLTLVGLQGETKPTFQKRPAGQPVLWRWKRGRLWFSHIPV